MQKEPKEDDLSMHAMRISNYRETSPATTIPDGAYAVMTGWTSEDMRPSTSMLVPVAVSQMLGACKVGKVLETIKRRHRFERR